MRHWIRVGLLTLAALTCLGTSKSLIGKKLVSPRIQASSGVTVVGKPTAALQENVNNQGCFSRQQIDFALRAEIRNETNAALRVHPDWIEVVVGFEKKQQTIRVLSARFSVPDAQKKPVGDGKTLGPKAQGKLLLRAPAVFSKKRLKEVRWVRINADLRGARLILEFRDINKLKTETMR
jgi:hypothetical protein